MTGSARHLLVAISAHGFGHLAQTAEVVNALRERLPSLRVTVRSALPHARLRARLTSAFEHRPEACDVGMHMSSALDILIEDSARAYAEFHQDWKSTVRDEAQRLAALAPDLVLANVPYRVLAGAAAAGIPAVALCSLNWADIYRHYFGQRPEAGTILRQIAAAYRSADCFLQPQPSMPMEDLPRRRSVGPIARRGRERRGELLRRAGLSGGCNRLVLIATGGVDLPLPVENWPQLQDACWIVPANWQIRRSDVIALETLDLPFIDVLASCDAVLTKPGYGSFSEAACNGIAVLYVARPDWPEEPHLVRWLMQNGRAREISREQLMAGRLAEDLDMLLALGSPQPVQPLGAAQAADILLQYLV